VQNIRNWTPSFRATLRQKRTWEPSLKPKGWLLVVELQDWKAHMSINATAVVKKETKVDPKKSNDKAFYASLSVLNEDGEEYGLPRYLSEFREVAVLLRREAGVTHEQLHERFAAYERGEEIRFPLTLESDEAIKNLGFDPKAA